MHRVQKKHHTTEYTSLKFKHRILALLFQSPNEVIANIEDMVPSDLRNPWTSWIIQGFGNAVDGLWALALGIVGGVAQWVARLTRNVEVVGSSPIQGPRCFLEHDTLP